MDLQRNAVKMEFFAASCWASSKVRSFLTVFTCDDDGDNDNNGIDYFSPVAVRVDRENCFHDDFECEERQQALRFVSFRGRESFTKEM